MLILVNRNILDVFIMHNLKFSVINVNHEIAAYDPGKPVEHAVNYSCENCVLSDVLCNGESLLSTDKVSITHAKKIVTFNFPR